MQINLDIVERQIDSDGSIEDSYRWNSKQGKLLLSKLYSSNQSNLIPVDPNEIELVSYHLSDNLSYKTNSIVIIYNQLPDGIDNSNLRDYYGVKVDFENSKVQYKYYKNYSQSDKSFLLNLLKPFQIQIGDEFGIGFYGDKFEDSNFYDYYFYSKEIEEIYKLFDFKEPEESKKYHNINLALFGLTLDKNLKPVKLKRYIYPNDIRLENRNQIYGI